MSKLKVLYVRVSTADQKLDRQQVNVDDCFLVTDKCSGAIAFFDRDGGKLILELIKKNKIGSLSIHSIDRLGRDLKDILNTVFYFNNLKIPITFISHGLTTIDEDGKVNFITAMVISFLGTVAEMERSQIRERQLEGIRLAKHMNLYTGRKKGSVEDTLKFLSKPKNKKALDYIRADNKLTLKEISVLSGVHINTLTKIKKLGLQHAA